jgi:hypothetical protein
MINDPIVNEIRQIRQAYAAKFNNDLHAICEDLRRQERESGREFQTPARRAEESARREPTVTNAGTGASDPGGQNG